MSKVPLEIINYWRAVEELTPSTVEDTELVGNVVSIQREVLKDHDIPWMNRKDFQHENSDTHIWTYRVFLGVISVKNATSKIISRLNPNYPSLSQHTFTKGVTCICSFQINLYGQPIYDSLEISDWFVCINKFEKKEGLNYINNKYKIINSIKDLFKNLSDKLAHAENKKSPIKFDDLKVFTENCILQAGWKDFITEKEIQNFVIIHSCYLKREIRSNLENSNDALDKNPAINNSYITSDLNYIHNEIRKDPSNWSNGLKQYLNYEQNQKLDSYNYRESLKRFISPKYLLLSRWPSNGDHPLNLAQQAAANLSFLDKEGLFSVNGPPGTGKSTLLRDIIANIVVNRASVLSSFNNADNAFTTAEVFKHNFTTYKVWELSPELYGHEIFVTSSNNNAVENISREIPKLSSIDSKWSVDYFADIASHVQNEHCWGLGAAALGKKTNRIDYFNKFWNHKKQKDDPSNVMGMEEYLTTNTLIPDWVKARENFLITRNKCHELKQDLIELENVISNLPALKMRKIGFIEKIKELEAGTKITQGQLALIDKVPENLNMNIADLKWTLEQKILLKPSMFKRIWGFITGNFHLNNWQKEITLILNNIGVLQKELSDVTKEKNRLSEKYDKDTAKLEKNIKAKEELDFDIDACNLIIRKFKLQMDECFPDNKLWDLPNNELQKLLPWNFKKLHELRGKLFVEALNLHKAFILNTSSKFLDNLKVMNLIIRTDSISTEYNHLLKSVWASFFMVIPVVSSTFSSFANLCQGLKKDSIGWMLIDEAGQATPQSAVGAIWRAKRTIIVGDPKQIKPVVTTSNYLNEFLKDYYKVSNKWSSLNESVQSVSDRCNKYGVFLDQDEANATGWPLIVHRRCNEPMFSVANKIAYNNIMVYATKPSSNNLNNYFTSSWINVESFTFKNHWSNEEGLTVLSMITKIINFSNDLPSLYVITPFRSVSLEMRKKLRENINSWKPKHVTYQMAILWIINSVGTLHTFQGKEAEIVIILLGGNPDKPNSTDWLSTEPNMLNVAITRAKNLIYVVGNYNRWSKLPYFNELSYALPKIEYSSPSFNLINRVQTEKYEK